jgi:hypothetical protein
MSRKHLLIGAAACAALACAGWARAAVSVSDVTVNPSSRVVFLDDATTTTAPTAAASTAPSGPPPLPLSGAILTNIPHFADTGITVTGYVEGSWTYSSHTLPGNILTDRSFDTKAESLQFDAIDLSVSRSVDYTKKTVDFGFAVEAMYGWDSDYIHSNGLTLVSYGKQADGDIAGSGTTATIHPKAQLDLVQANFTVMVPVGHGIGIEGGKFDTLVGYEVIDAPSNPFFSHSYIFAEEPFTHTGLLGIYNLFDPSDATQSLVVTAGFSRGWDQATKDDNGDLDIMGQVKWTVTNKWSVIFTGITGNENAGTSTADGWRTILDLNGTYTVSDQITLGYNGLFGWQAQDGGFNPGVAGPVADTGTGIWYGVAAYAQWKPNDYVAVNARAEWFDDQDGAAPTFLSSGAPGSNNSNVYYEFTLGVTYKPFADDKYLNGLAIRPEVRWDYADPAAFSNNAAGLPTQNDQFTFGAEAYFAF